MYISFNTHDCFLINTSSFIIGVDCNVLRPGRWEETTANDRSQVKRALLSWGTLGNDVNIVVFAYWWIIQLDINAGINSDNKNSFVIYYYQTFLTSSL